MRDLIMAKYGLGIFHFPSGLGIDIEGVMAELREVLESRGWEFGVNCSPLATLFCLPDWMRSVALSFFGGEVRGRFGPQNRSCGQSPAQHTPCTKPGPKPPLGWSKRSIKSPLEGKGSVSAHSDG